eukprot:snap_masked-scaffold_3-processed-gene-1.30-mRNA-1 protein AED:1.00 eAED:1.00 QI:0/0/0/0/1/1/3/0/61
MSINVRVAIESLIAVDSVYEHLPGPLKLKTQNILERKVEFLRLVLYKYDWVDEDRPELRIN